MTKERVPDRGTKRRYGLGAVLLLMLTFILLPLGQAWGNMLIDDFNVTQTIQSSGPTSGWIAWDTVSGGGILGGNRDMRLDQTAGSGGSLFRVRAISGRFSHNQEVSVAGRSETRWDGMTGLDLTEGGTVHALVLKGVQTDHPTMVLFTVNGSSTYTVSVPVTGPPGNDYIIPFSTFSNPAAFQSVNDFDMLIPNTGTTVETDFALDEISTMSLLRCTKTFDKSTVLAGETINVTLTVYNDDPDSARNFNITDTIDVGMTYVAASASPAPTGSTAQTVTWNNFSIAANSSQVFTYQILAGDEAGNYCNDVDVERVDDTSITTTCQDCVDITLPPPPTCTKVFDKATAIVGETINVTLTVTNHDTTSARSFDITDAIDLGMTYVGGTASPAPSTSSAQALAWNGFSIAANSSQVFTYQLLVGSTAGHFCNDVDVVMVDYGTLTTTCQDCVDVSLPPGPECDKVFDKHAAVVGETINVTLTVYNNDTTSARSFDITDAIDVGMTYVSGSASLAPSSSGPQNISWDNVSIGASSNLVITYQLLVGSTAGHFCNDVDVVMVDYGTLTTTCQDCVDVSLPPGPTCTKVFDKDTALVGETINVTLTVTNHDTTSARSFDITDAIDVGMTYVGGTASPAPSTSSAQALAWNGFSIAANSSQVFTYQLLVGSTAGHFCNDVDVVMVDYGTLTTTCQDCVDVSLPPGPRCTKVFDKETVEYGETINVTLTIYNDDASSARDFNVTDTMPAGGELTYVIGSSDVAPTTEAADKVTWDNLSIPASGNVVIHYQILVGDQEGHFCNDVDVIMVAYPALGTHCEDCVTVEPPPPPPEVPTFTQWGIMGLLFLLTVSGVWLIRRRRSMS